MRRPEKIKPPEKIWIESHAGYNLIMSEQVKLFSLEALSLNFLWKCFKISVVFKTHFKFLGLFLKSRNILIRSFYVIE